MRPGILYFYLDNARARFDWTAAMLKSHFQWYGDCGSEHTSKPTLTAEEPIKPVKPVKLIRGADWLTGLITLTGYFGIPFSIGGTS